MTENHEHVFGAMEHARMTGEPHRKCVVAGCRVISLDFDEEEDEPMTEPTRRDIADDALVIREGASTRTADALASLFIMEAAWLTRPADAPEDYDASHDERIPDYVQAAMADADEHGWTEDPDNGQALYDFIPIAEGWLSDRAMYVAWDDGYVIYNTADWSEEDWSELDG